MAQVSIAVDAERVSENLSRAIRFPTIATGDEATQEHASFREFANWAEQTYPEVYQAMQLEMIEEHTILLKWQGADPTLKPILLTAHYLANY